MRRLVVLALPVVLVAAVVLGACSSSAKQASTATTTTSTTATGLSTSTTADAPTTTTASTTTTIATTTTGTTTTAPACPVIGSTGPRSTAADEPSALLTSVDITTEGCTDRVFFSFRPHGAAVPSCTIAYRSGPFSQDGSGAPVAVAGVAFAVVRCAPAYGYDFESGAPTYKGPKRVAPVGAHHVRQFVETGDFEGVVTWVIGLDGPRPFVITATGTPVRQLVITFS